ncbi:MAG: DUF192 domain-containing protein [Candidatus Caenarcaniphilales bacterium]|nr:DUF192 domain-containing protein [Candidatus Caenarcaniphilales bacterium]
MLIKKLQFSDSSYLKSFLIIFSLVIAISFLGIINFTQAKSFNDLQFEKLEIADSLKEIQIGLMNRKSLCSDCGMLFILPIEGKTAFWMKNTYIPLDILFISKNGEVITIHENAQPLNELNRYWPKRNAKYVLEVNAGYSQKHNINEGEFFNIDKLFEQSRK